MNGLFEFQKCILDEKGLGHRLEELMIVQLVSLNSILDNSVCYSKVPVGKWVLGVFLSVFENRGERVSPHISYCKYVSRSTIYSSLQMLSKDVS